MLIVYHCLLIFLFPTKQKYNLYNRIDKTIQFNQGWKSRDAVPKLVKEYLSDELMIDELITHDLPIESINEAINLMKNGKW